MQLNSGKIKFLIDEYGSYTFVTLDNIPATRSRETPHITGEHTERMKAARRNRQSESSH